MKATKKETGHSPKTKRRAQNLPNKNTKRILAWDDMTRQEWRKRTLKTLSKNHDQQWLETLSDLILDSIGPNAKGIEQYITPKTDYRLVMSISNALENGIDPDPIIANQMKPGPTWDYIRLRLAGVDEQKALDIAKLPDSDKPPRALMYLDLVGSQAAPYSALLATLEFVGLIKGSSRDIPATRPKTESGKRKIIENILKLTGTTLDRSLKL